MVVNAFPVASSFSHYVVLLPALLVGAGLIGGILILLGRAFAETVREARHPRLIIGGLVALAGAVVLLTYLGVNLPKE
jgi:hypothetical protein